MDHRTLRLVETLADAGHFGRAAERLGIAQPHLSTALKALELSLGVRLFERRPRVVLTAQGRLLLDAWRRAAGEIDRALHHARAAERGELGRVRLGYASSVLMTALGERLAEFRRAHPDVELVMLDLHSGEHRDALRHSRIDVALSRETWTERGFRSARVLKDELCVVFATDHPLARSPEPIDLAQLAENPLVSFRRSAVPTLHAQILARCAASGIPLRTAQEADDWPSILLMVSLGFGVTLAPSALTGPFADRLATRPLAGAPVPADLHLCHASAPESQAVRALVRFLDPTFEPAGDRQPA